MVVVCRLEFVQTAWRVQYLSVLMMPYKRHVGCCCLHGVLLRIY